MSLVLEVVVERMGMGDLGRFEKVAGILICEVHISDGYSDGAFGSP